MQLKSNFTAITQAIALYNEFEKYTFEITATFPNRSQWVSMEWCRLPKESHISSWSTFVSVVQCSKPRHVESMKNINSIVRGCGCFFCLFFLFLDFLRSIKTHLWHTPFIRAIYHWMPRYDIIHCKNHSFYILTGECYRHVPQGYSVYILDGNIDIQSSRPL